jgi:hypothetical protein
MIAGAILITISVPAYANAYTCTILQDDKEVKKCSISTSGSNNCSFGFSSDLIGGCAVQTVKNQPLEHLFCAVFRPGAEQQLMSGTEKPDSGASIQAMREQPGFMALAQTLLNTNSFGFINLSYRENDKAPVLALSCQR